MAHRRDDGNVGQGNGPGHRLLVKGPQVLPGATASAGDDEVDVVSVVHLVDGGGDLLCRPLPLHPHRHHQHLSQGPALAQNANHIPHCSSRRGCHQGDTPGIGGQWLLLGRVKEALGLQLLFQLLEGPVQGSPAVLHQLGTVQLILAIPGIDRHPAVGDHRQAVDGFKAQPGRIPPEHDAADAPLLVLEGKVVVPGGVALVVGHLAPHQQSPQQGVAVHQLLEIPVDLGDGIDG